MNRISLVFISLGIFLAFSTFSYARNYDPKNGRFLQEDPVWHTNLYTYTNNNPVCDTDPSGTLTYSEQLSLAMGGISSILGMSNPVFEEWGDLMTAVTPNDPSMRLLSAGMSFNQKLMWFHLVKLGVNDFSTAKFMTFTGTIKLEGVQFDGNYGPLDYGGKFSIFGNLNPNNNTITVNKFSVSAEAQLSYLPAFAGAKLYGNNPATFNILNNFSANNLKGYALNLNANSAYIWGLYPDMQGKFNYQFKYQF